mmetsp:Transcript_26952/g.45924  ORF Transcript_26952/g.45924 Transcript_26952/m.45924 type:complete len:211 (+) Transcript_26952:104-736(+)|eukprot:CAMPEP_0183706328 /NCGR_PEP_ID=MMETSP0737-20130205/3203_1 /TAXON_ID=385413 /ORGANISM="Thalassiosira miniscula, Strain CCMP1093" /LENGTH=210 /DNA_ID=CAMNT_0025933727 /DNA_START=68 /DNA_END=700 /DNA_ORIENTATION=+
MRSFALLAAIVYAAVSADAFQQVAVSSAKVASSRSATALYGYIPSGFTKESWAKFQEKEKKQKEARNLGRLGPKGFQSRSMQSFQEALERGEAAHLMPMENAKERLRRGEIKKEDIPYMQRGGAWDNSDVKGAKKKKWLASDQEYAGGGYKKSQSVSILGEGKGLDWTGKRDKTGPVQGVKLGKNYKAPNVSQMKKGTAEKPKKKMFGFF